MYNLSKEQLESAEGFIGKLGDSMVKSHIEKLFAEVKPTMRMTSEQMEKFLSMSTQLPAEVQSFPQSWSMAVKNTPSTEEAEKDFKAKDKTDLTENANQSIEGVKDKKTPKNKEEVEHKLNVKEHTVERGKEHAASKANVDKDPEATAQKTEDKRIVAANKQVTEKQKADKPATKKAAPAKVAKGKK